MIKQIICHIFEIIKLSLDFSPQMNVFLGENAQGKQILGVIYVLAMTKSHRTNKDVK